MDKEFKYTGSELEIFERAIIGKIIIMNYLKIFTK